MLFGLFVFRLSPRSCSVAVITVDSESTNPGSSPGRSEFLGAVECIDLRFPLTLELCPSGSTEEHLTTDQRVVGSNPISDVSEALYTNLPSVLCNTASWLLSTVAVHQSRKLGVASSILAVALFLANCKIMWIYFAYPGVPCRDSSAGRA